MGKGYRKYFGKKILWFLVTLVAAVLLNFILPRLMPGDPVTAMMARVTSSSQDVEATRRIYEHYMQQFGTDKPMVQQFFIYIGNVMRGDFGLSFSQYPRPVSDILKSALPWTIGLQLPAILVGWSLGNILGAIAAYVRKGFDKVLLPVMLFLGGIPAFCMAVILL
jgi:peptide/nickel transport system permease protein